MYLITLEGARRALRRIFPIAEQLDQPDGVLRSVLRSGQCVPPIAQTAHLGSDVQTRWLAQGLASRGDKRAPAPRAEDDAPPHDPAPAAAMMKELADCGELRGIDALLEHLQ